MEEWTLKNTMKMMKKKNTFNKVAMMIQKLMKKTLK